MTGRASATRPSRRPLLARTLAASLACFAITSTYVVSASAKRDHARPAPAAPAPENNIGAPRAQGPAPVNCCAPPAPRAAAPAAKSHRDPQAGKAQGSTAPLATAPTGVQGDGGRNGSAGGRSGPPEKQPRAERQNARGEHPRRGPDQTGQTGEEASPATGAGEGEGQAAPVASSQRQGQKGKHHKAKEPKAKEPKPHAPGPARSTASAASATIAPVPLALVPATPTPAPAPAAIPPSVLGQRASAATDAFRRRARGRTRPVPRIVAAQAPSARALTTAGAPLPAQAPVKKAPTHRAGVHRAQSQLATTVTRIINVIPPLVWIVIGALTALALALGASSRLVARRARRLARQRRELLDDVGLLQAALLPVLPARLGPVGTSAAYRPASGPGAGGDFYDVFALADGQLAVIVGDVSGHGRQALPHTTLLRFTLRAYLEAGLSPRSALQAATPVLERQLGSSFATVVLATYNPRERILVYACAGHPPPVVAGTESITPLTVSSSPPIGGGQPTGRRQTVVSIPGAALACFFTDGVVEARVGEELFGTPRLRRTLAELGPDAGAATLLDRVAEQSDRRPDDMAACMLHVEGDPAAPIVQVEELEIDRRDLVRGRARRFLEAGGLEAGEIDEILADVRGALARHGGVVLELHLAEGPPQVVLRPQNVEVLHGPSRAVAGL
jgi:serine phosphatase RsbU (regulator of sigma subunit)